MKQVSYHVAYSWASKKKNQSGFGNIALTVDKVPITVDVLEKWKEYISNVLDGANIVIINWIKLDK